MAIEKQTTQHAAHNIDMTPKEFRTLGYKAVDRVADLLENMRNLPVAAPEGQRLLVDRDMSAVGISPAQLIDDAANLLFNHSTFNGHPRFWGLC